MTAIDQIQISKPHSIGAGFLQALKDKWVRYRVYRQTLKELCELSGRELADLGMHRSNLRSAAYAAAYGDQ